MSTDITQLFRKTNIYGSFNASDIIIIIYYIKLGTYVKTENCKIVATLFKTILLHVH